MSTGVLNGLNLGEILVSVVDLDPIMNTSPASGSGSVADPVRRIWI